jgi:hypothetical protein
MHVITDCWQLKGDRASETTPVLTCSCSIVDIVFVVSPRLGKLLSSCWLANVKLDSVCWNSVWVWQLIRVTGLLHS